MHRTPVNPPSDPPGNQTVIPNPLTPYDSKSKVIKPLRRHWRTLLKRARPIKQFAAPILFDINREDSDPEIAAQWGEHIFVEDCLFAIHRDGSFSSRRHIVARLHGSESLADWDEVLRPFDSRTQLLRIPHAGLYLPDGTTQTIRPQLHTYPLPDSQSNNWGRTVQLLFAPLKPGVIVDFMEQYDDFSNSTGWPGFHDQFFMQTNFPCQHRRYTVAVAKPYQLQFKLHHGAKEPRVQQLEDYHVCTWEAKEVPGVEIDDWTPPARDFAAWIDVTTATTWAPYAEKFRQEIEPGENLPEKVKQLAKELTTDKTNSLDKAKAVYGYVSRDVRYGRPQHESEVRTIRSSERMFEDQQGDCKDKSALLVQLLRVLGFKATLAIVQTGDTGRIPYLASPRFNHAVVKLEIEQQEYWLDAAGGVMGFGELPRSGQEIQALLLEKEGFCFAQTPKTSQAKLIESHRYVGKLDRQGDYEGTLATSCSGEIASQLRHQLIDRSPDQSIKVLQSWLSSNHAGAIGSNFSYDTIEDLGKAAHYTCLVKIPQMALEIKNILLLQLKWTAAVNLSGPVAQVTRSQPLLLPREYNILDEHTIELPAGITPIAVPEEVRLETDWGNYSCHWQVEGQRVRCERKVCLTGNIVPSEDYPNFKDFWRQAHRADNMPLVLQDFS